MYASVLHEFLVTIEARRGYRTPATGIMNHHVGAWNWTLVLHNHNKSS